MKNRLVLIALFFTLLLATKSNANAQWEQVNNTYAGKTNCFATIGTNLFAGTQNGILLTTDNGASWDTVNNGLTDLSVRSLGVIGTNLVAGTFNGIFLSTDNGASWNGVTNSLLALLVSSFAAIGTNLFAGTYNGVFHSTDSGATWTLDTFDTPPTQEVYSLAVIGSNLFSATNSGGVFLSTNNGISWSAVNHGFPTIPIDIDINSLVAIGNNLFAQLENVNDLFISTDSGKNWIVDSTITIYDGTVAVGNILFEGSGPGGVYRSTNGGAGWSAVDSGFPTNSQGVPVQINVSCVGESGDNLFAGTNGDGIWRCSLSYLNSFGQSGVTESQSQTSQPEIQSYPNPFSQSTTITFSSPESGVAEISVVNILGTTVARIFSGVLESGEHSFTWDANGLPPGMYECIVQMNGSVERVPIVLAR